VSIPTTEHAHALARALGVEAGALTAALLSLGLSLRSRRRPNAAALRDTIRADRAAGSTLADLACRYGISASYAYVVCRGIPSPHPRRQRILAAHQAGEKVSVIASREGVTRQAVYGVLQRDRRRNESIQP